MPVFSGPESNYTVLQSNAIVLMFTAMNKSLKLQWALLTALLCIAFSLFFHFSESSDSMLNDKSWKVSEEYLHLALEIHQTDITFARRPLSNWAIVGISNLSGLSIGVSFIVLNYLAYFLSGILLYLLSLKLGENYKRALFNMLVYFLCFSNLFAFFPPVYSYDEPLQFLFLFASLLALFSKKWILFLFSFTLATIARESSIFLLPGIFLFLQRFIFDKPVALISWESFRRGLLFISPLILFVLFLTVFIQYNKLEFMSNSAAQERFSHFKLNFEEQPNAIESFISMYLILGLPVYFLVQKSANPLPPRDKSFVHAFFLVLLINTLIVLFFTKAREARLFVIPLFLIWPIFSSLFKNELLLFVNWQAYKKLFRSWIHISLLLFCIFLSNLFCHHVFISTVGGDDYFSGYLFFLNALILLHLFLKVANRLESPVEK